MTLGGDDLQALDLHRLRQEVLVIDRASMVELTMRKYLSLARPDVHSNDMMVALDAVGLDKTIMELEQGLDTDLAPTGWPLSVVETMQLKLAAAILSQPRVLVINQLFDTVPRRHLEQALKALKANGKTTVIMFSSREDFLDFDNFLLLGRNAQTLFDTYDAFNAHVQRAQLVGDSADTKSAYLIEQ
jgi:putative ABC transport system ATP-binding protein